MLKLHVGSVNQEHGWIAGAGMAEEEGKLASPLSLMYVSHSLSYYVVPFPRSLA